MSFRTSKLHRLAAEAPQCCHLVAVSVPDVGQTAGRDLAVDGRPAGPVAVLAATLRGVGYAHVVYRLGMRLGGRHALRRRLGAGELAHRSDPVRTEAELSRSSA